MSSPVCTESGFIGQSQRCCSLASCAQCSGKDLLRTEMRIAEGVGSEWLGSCKRFLRAELNISEGSALACNPLSRRVGCDVDPDQISAAKPHNHEAVK